MSSPTAFAGNRPTTPLAVSQLLVDDPVEHRAARRRRACGPSRRTSAVVEDVGERALHLPGVEERLPVDVAAELGEVGVAEDPHVLGRAAAAR